jgi:caffeoyl-CoA O-methyltransferase
LSKENTGLNPDFGAYIDAVTLREPELLARLRQETASHPQAGMQVSPTQGQFLNLLVRATGARRTLEVGVFTGYSSISVALALPDDGEIVACDVSEEFTAVSRRYWQEAGVAGKIRLHLGPAVETLRKLLAEGYAGTFDFAFIDADKENYQAYFDAVVELVRTGGLIVVDNVLWHGKIIDPSAQDSNTLAMRAFNERLHTDSRVAVSMIPIGDGLTLACKLR